MSLRLARTHHARALGSSARPTAHTVAHPSQAYDVVLLDWRMAEMDGMETARRIRGEARLLAQPVLILTTALGREYVDREGEAGASPLLLLLYFRPRRVTSLRISST
jgi:CheY-like chemotaxis protein